MPTIEIASIEIVWRRHCITSLQRQQSTSGHVAIFTVITFVSSDDSVAIEVDAETSIIVGTVDMNDEEILAGNGSCEWTA